MQYWGLVGFLSGCAQMNPIASNHSDEILRMGVDTIDANHHNAIAKHYEDAGNEMKAKLRAQKKLLQEYERRTLLLWTTRIKCSVTYCS